jgi:uncharacterized membrane protein YqjE
VSGTSDPRDRPQGLLEALRSLLAGVLQLLHTRVELFTLEIQEQVQRLLWLFVWTIVALFCGSLTVLMLCITVLVACWDSHRLLAAGCLTGGLLVLLLAALLALRTQWRASPRWLDASLDELQRDADVLRERSTRSPS